MVDPGLVLPFCNMVVVMASLTLPSAALSAKVSRTMRKAYGETESQYILIVKPLQVVELCKTWSM